MSGTTEPADEPSADPEAIYERLQAEIDRVLIGNEEAVEYLTIALLTRGHLLLEGVPGIAKTTLANLFARTSGLEYNRIQMTPDTLPADITGTHIYQQGTGSFELQRGPVFANLVVADEINRATAKTQSALLEAMQERRVTIEGETLSLPDPFMVVATQNPLESEGVFQLPEAQRDRFQFKLRLELPDRTDERELLDRFDDEPDLGPDDVEQVVEPGTLVDARETVSAVHVAESVKEYVLDLVAASRDHADVSHGGSPRATLAFLNGAKARAAINGRDYAIPDDVKSMAEPVLRHRLVLSTDADLSDVDPGDVVVDIVDSVEPPSAEAEFSFDAPAAGDGGAEVSE
ncbi:MoxR family ATPase [Natrinema thermotolerans]|uniref:MoxR family ATPase n=1 Tax=Natrinema thermotolerans TaxID=121872 RepID=A0AAF0T1S3_9EURY|nr:MoxR family ATPase [Natrinema thermotolerans]QCC60468.1 MoxR family ATPase [Natrinema thermotolerans]QCC61369.1 MoxR family ATPase [Natrinema thermotolerans]WMT07502.1 MoxR family ATPase [Natrinema thermotolerans]WMT08134.1 MoxR family ATPase [Natrinema thermotolerans]